MVLGTEVNLVGMNKARTTYRCFRVARRESRGWHYGATTNSVDYAYDGIGNFTTVTGGVITNTYSANELNQYEDAG